MKKKQGFHGSFEREDRTIEHKKNMENKISTLQIKRNTDSILPRNILKYGMIIYGKNKLLVGWFFEYYV